VPVHVLVADPSPAFAAMIKAVLEETRRFKVTSASSGAEAISVASRDSFDIVMLEAGIEDFSLRDAVTVLRRNQPYLPIIVVLPLGEQPLPDAAKFFDVQGLLTKPLYIPELPKQIEEALKRPVNGVTPPPRNPDGSIAGPASREAASKPGQPARKSAPPPPEWLDDVSRAAQYLTTLTLESSAEAALLMRGQQLIAFAGQCSQTDADELARLIAVNWAKDGGGGQGAQVKFLRLSSGADYLVYSTLAAEEVVLSMAFQAETPLGQIRKQAKRATDALLKSPVEASPQAQAAPATAEPAAPRSAPVPAGAESHPLPNPEPMAAPEEAAIDFGQAAQRLQVTSLTADPSPVDRAPTLNAGGSGNSSTENPVMIESLLLFDHPLDNSNAGPSVIDESLRRILEPGLPEPPPAAPAPKTDKLKTRPLSEIEAVEPIPDEASLNELSNKLMQLSRQDLSEPPSLPELPLAPMPAMRRTSHGVYDLSYTLLLIPRLPTTVLNSDLKVRIEHWLAILAEAYEWQTLFIRVEPDHVEISLSCPPADSPEKIARVLMQDTSDKVLAEFTRLAATHAKRPGAFWATGYYVVAPGRRLTPEEIGAFVEYQRREQSGSR
jgi:REP element-mobilizing transposase RayT/CheY-like chemotaxis protein